MEYKSPDALRFGTVGSPQTALVSGTAAAIANIRQLGLWHLEIAWTQSVRIGDEACAEIRAAAAQHGVTLSVHAPYFINLNSQTDELMEKSDARLLAAARRGFLAGATDIIFHPGSYHEQEPEAVFQRAKRKLTELTRLLADEGVAVTLRPETMGKSAMFGTLEECVRLSAEVPGVLPCIDWAHLHARRGDGSFNSYAEFAAALELVKRELGDDALRRCHFHLSGIAYTRKGEKAHVPLNEADLHYRELMQAFVDYGVAGAGCVEAPLPFQVADALVLQATYRRLRDSDKPLEQEAD
jgi:deoxyribonuclease-4